jgi:hypothetical protein
VTLTDLRGGRYDALIEPERVHGSLYKVTTNGSATTTEIEIRHCGPTTPCTGCPPAPTTPTR